MSIINFSPKKRYIKFDLVVMLRDLLIKVIEKVLGRPGILRKKGYLNPSALWTGHDRGNTEVVLYPPRSALCGFGLLCPRIGHETSMSLNISEGVDEALLAITTTAQSLQQWLNHLKIRDNITITARIFPLSVSSPSSKGCA